MKLNEPNVLKVRQYSIDVGRNTDKKLRVMLTGDWHISPIVSERQLGFLKEALVEAEPDIIILQGDMVDSPVELKRETSLKKLTKELSLCSAIAPTVLVLGSHDYITPTRPPRNMEKFALPFWRKICKKCGVQLLMNEWAEFPGIKIFGAFQDERCLIRREEEGNDQSQDKKIRYEDSAEGFLECLKDSGSAIHAGRVGADNKHEVVWFAAHAPLLNTEIVKLLEPFDVVSFGHTHGGIVPLGLDELFAKFNWHFGLVSANHRPFPRCVRGTMPLSESTMLTINPGMVAAQFCAPRPLQNLNFIKAAEVSVIEVGGKEKDRSDAPDLRECFK